MLIETGIAPNLRKSKPRVWSGKKDNAQIWANYETLKVTFPEKFFLGSCDELRKEHQGLVTIQLFTKFKRGLNSLPSDVFWW